MQTHFDVKELAKWKKEDLQKLASEMGLSDGGTKEELAKRIAAEEVEVPEEEEPQQPETPGETEQETPTPEVSEKLVIDYLNITIFDVQEMPIDLYLYFMREANIHKLMQTKEGREYLDNCWRMEQTKPDRKKLREKMRKGER